MTSANKTKINLSRKLRLGADARVTVDAAEEHHGGLPEETPRTTGTVNRIAAVHCRYAPAPGQHSQALYPVGGSGVQNHVESADGWTPDHGDLRFVGYLVDLTIQEVTSSNAVSARSAACESVWVRLV